MLDILKEMPWVTAIILTAWLPVIIITLLHLINRKDISITRKIVWLIIGLIPIIGLLIYGLINYKVKKSIVWLTVLATIISLITVWYFIFYQPSIAKRDVTKEAAIALSVTSLLKEFEVNETEANIKYTNKVIEVSGVVEKILNDETGMVIFLQTNIEGKSFSGRLKAKQATQENATITLKGILTGYILGQIQLNEAVITNGANTALSNEPTSTKDSTINLKVPIKKDSIKVVQPTEKIYSSSKGLIKFISITAVEDIEASNNQVISTISSNGKVQFAALIKGFLFENELMQKHFNEDKYMHSDKFSKSEFEGTITNINSINFNTTGKYKVNAVGNLTIKGITKKITTEGTIDVNNNTILLHSIFKLKIKDFGIITDEIAEQIDIVVSATYKK